MTNTIALSFMLCFTQPEREAVKVALSAIESGHNDQARGRHGERSRFQVMPSVWRAHCPYRLSEATNPVYAWICATNILDRRVESFHRIMGRRPTFEELFALWNSPKAFYKVRTDAYQMRYLSKSTRDKCARFQNLVESELKPQTKGAAK